MPADIPDQVLELMASKFRMLSDATRLAILRVLMRGERSDSRVVAETARNQANVSKHLKHLKMLAEEGLVASRKEGLQVFYRVDDPLVERHYRHVCDTLVEELKRVSDARGELLRKLEQP